MPKQPTTLTLIIPAYNEQSRIAECLRSVAAQSVMPDEVIVVDNGSTDRTAEIAANFGFVTVIRETRQGVVFARNAGFDTASSDIIARIDADTSLPRDWVAYIKSFYDNPSNYDKAWVGSARFSNVHLTRLVSWTYRVMAFRLNKILVGHASLWGSNMAVRQYHWQAVRSQVCMQSDIHEDLDLSMHMSKSGFAVFYDDKNNRVTAKLRRVYDDRRSLWEYLQMWPRTLRMHGRRTWIVCWFFGALMLYLATFLLVGLGLAEDATKALRLPLRFPADAASED